MANVDTAIVNVAAPSVHATLGASGGELELVVSGYVLAYAMLLIAPGTAALAALPAEEYPHLTENASTARDVPPDEEFGHGLDLLMRGLQASLED